MTENQQPATNEESLTTYGEKKSGQKIRLRAILLGSLFALAICLITPFNNAYRQATPLGGGHFPLAPFYILVWLMLLTAFLRMIFKGRNLITWCCCPVSPGRVWRGPFLLI
jgi:hypothetical protein